MSFGQASAPFPAAPPFFNAQVVACETHAIGTAYVGPPVYGDTFAGWPLSELVKAAHPGMGPMDRAMVSSQLMAKHNLHNGAFRPAPNAPGPRPYSYEERLAMRMQWGRLEEALWAPGFEHVAIHPTGASTTMHVWVITKQGQSIVLEDDAPLFPSDALITKLNMLKE